LWYTRPDVNRIGRFITRQNGTPLSIWETPLPVSNAAPWGIVANNSGSGIVATSNAAKTITWNSPYYTFFVRMPLLLCFSGANCQR
jgi:hypothetical protein